MDNLEALYRSTEALFARFGVGHDTAAQLRCVAEEVAELTIVSAQHNSFMRWTKNSDVAQEAADVIVTVLGTLITLGITHTELTDAIQHVIAKNDAKTPATHAVNSAGKIARIEK